MVGAFTIGQRYVDTNNPTPPPLFSNPSLVVFCVDIPPVQVYNLDVLCRRKSSRLDEMNDHLKTKLVKTFMWDIELGWRHQT